MTAGEVHAIVGENGSGKSTLVKLLAGVHRPDRGSLEMGNREQLAGFGSPGAALQAGIVAVFQEVLVIEAQSLLENVWLGVDGLLRRTTPEYVKRERTIAVMTELLGESPPIDTALESLPLSVRQACVIARALVRDPRVLILDESTSALDVEIRDRLFDVIRRRKRQGGSVIFISHRMDEIEAIADRVTVMRSGRTVTTLNSVDATPNELVRLMSGQEHLTGNDATATSERLRDRGQSSVLAARSVVLEGGAPPVDFALCAGELVGLGGLEGQGQDQFLRALWNGSRYGDIVRLGESGETIIRSSSEATKLGIAYVPRDRRSESIFSTLSIRDNFAAATLESDGHLGVVSRRRTDLRLGPYREQLAIKLGEAHQPITTLSGGNQQKIIMARWLATAPAVLLLNDPTRGVDLNAKRDLYGLLRGLAEQGVAVVMLSTELDELVELMDRVLVFREQTLHTELAGDQLGREALVASFFGHQSSADV
jgi:ABC-type sugar transport system ATPase subunit